MEERKTILPHKLLLENRQGGTVTGVLDVEAFDEKEILLVTNTGIPKIIIQSFKKSGLIVKRQIQAPSKSPRRRKLLRIP